ncbi:MAG: hypothetical protein MK142_06365, partial [Pseudomonadales bacterium]|nr:hypothetical protein [Pseudomonadales bacterium]
MPDAARRARGRNEPDIDQASSAVDHLIGLQMFAGVRSGAGAADQNRASVLLGLAHGLGPGLGNGIGLGLGLAR